MTNGIRCAVAEVKFFTDFSDPMAKVLLLGVIAEAAIDGEVRLAMVGKHRATAEELESTSGFNRTQLEHLQNTLSACFGEAVAIRDNHAGTDDGTHATLNLGDVLHQLAERHSYAFHIDRPSFETIPLKDLGITPDCAKPDKFGLMRWLEKRFTIARGGCVTEPDTSVETDPYLIAA